MANYPLLGATLSEQLSCPFTTADFVGRKLRADGRITNRGRGKYAAHMTSKDATVWSMALCLNREKNSDVIAEVDELFTAQWVMAGMLPHRSRDLEPLIRGTIQFLRPLQIVRYENRTAGAGLTSLFDDLRSGAFDEWAGDDQASISADFDSVDRSLMVSIDKAGTTAAVTYGPMELRDEELERKKRVQKIFRVRTPVFRAIAEALGPPEP